MTLVMVRTTNNLHIIGKKKFFKNLFSSKREIVISNPYFVDFVYNQNAVVERVYLNTMKLLYAKPQCTLNTRHILFSVKPDDELIEMYENLTSTIKQNKNELELL